MEWRGEGTCVYELLPKGIDDLLLWVISADKGGHCVYSLGHGHGAAPSPAPQSPTEALSGCRRGVPNVFPEAQTCLGRSSAAVDGESSAPRLSTDWRSAARNRASPSGHTARSAGSLTPGGRETGMTREPKAASRRAVASRPAESSS